MKDFFMIAIYGVLLDFFWLYSRKKFCVAFMCYVLLDVNGDLLVSLETYIDCKVLGLWTHNALIFNKKVVIRDSNMQYFITHVDNMDVKWL